MKRRRRIPKNGWTPRERVELLVMIAGNAHRVPDADALLAQLRAAIREQEGHADAMTPEWVVRG